MVSPVLSLCKREYIEANTVMQYNNISIDTPSIIPNLPLHCHGADVTNSANLGNPPKFPDTLGVHWERIRVNRNA